MGFNPFKCRMPYLSIEMGFNPSIKKQTTIIINRDGFQLQKNKQQLGFSQNKLYFIYNQQSFYFLQLKQEAIEY
jgi:hypothetical protein